VSRGFDLSDYEPVEERLARFWKDHPGGRVLTSLHYSDERQFIFQTALYRADEDRPFATGFAQEIIGSTPVNKTSALENCETSSTGRALANAGYAPKGHRPSREEMAKAARPQASKAQHDTIKALSGQLDDMQKAAMRQWMEQNTLPSVRALDPVQADAIIGRLEAIITEASA
jgi:hypothetical protein